MLGEGRFTQGPLKTSPLHSYTVIFFKGRHVEPLFWDFWMKTPGTSGLFITVELNNAFCGYWFKEKKQDNAN